jgi:hypothetical protein
MRLLRDRAAYAFDAPDADGACAAQQRFASTPLDGARVFPEQEAHLFTQPRAGRFISAPACR